MLTQTISYCDCSSKWTISKMPHCYFNPLRLIFFPLLGSFFTLPSNIVLSTFRAPALVLFFVFFFPLGWQILTARTAPSQKPEAARVSRVYFSEAAVMMMLNGYSITKMTVNLHFTRIAWQQKQLEFLSHRIPGSPPHQRPTPSTTTAHALARLARCVGARPGSIVTTLQPHIQ